MGFEFGLWVVLCGWFPLCSCFWVVVLGVGAVYLMVVFYCVFRSVVVGVI